MNRNYIVGIIIAIVVIVLIIAVISRANNDNVGGIYSTPNTEEGASTLSPTNNNLSENRSESSEMVTVRYTNSGFNPKNITVKEGQAIRFTNESSGAMSVASDPHPTHTNYPEFDQYKTNFRGQKTFDFTFGKSGTWGYHNHLNPSATGTVTVQ